MYYGGQFYLWGKPVSREKTLLLQVINKYNLITWSYVKYLALIAYVDVGPSTLLWLPQWHPLKRIMMFLSQCSRDQSRCFFLLYTESDQQLIWFCFIYMLKLRLCFCNKIEKQNTTPLEQCQNTTPLAQKYNTSSTEIQHL